MNILDYIRLENIKTELCDDATTELNRLLEIIGYLKSKLKSYNVFFILLIAVFIIIAFTLWFTSSESFLIYPLLGLGAIISFYFYLLIQY